MQNHFGSRVLYGGTMIHFGRQLIDIEGQAHSLSYYRHVNNAHYRKGSNFL
jgi:hypothetical protein